MLSDEVRTYQFTIPAGTTQAAPAVNSMAFDVRIVKGVQILFPPGCSGYVGAALQSAGQPIVPFNNGAWIVADGETIEWENTNAVHFTTLALRAYNTGGFNHTLYVRLFLNLPPLPAPVEASPLVGARLVGSL